MAEASRADGRGRIPRGTGQIVASLTAMTGDWDLAEECAQDALTRALQTRDHDGVPGRLAPGSPLRSGDRGPRGRRGCLAAARRAVRR